GCSVQRCLCAWRWIIVAHSEHAAIGLHSRPGAPPSDERARESGVKEVDRDGVIKYPVHSGWCHRPAVSATVLVEPGGHLRMPLPQAAGWNANPDANGKTPLSHCDQFTRVTRHPKIPSPLCTSIIARRSLPFL